MFEAIGNQTDKDVLIASSEALVNAGGACRDGETMAEILKCKRMLDAIVVGNRKLWDGTSDNLTPARKKKLYAVLEIVQKTLAKVPNPCVFCGTAGNDGVPGVLSGNPEVADGWCCELAAKVRADATCPECGDPLPDCEMCGWPYDDPR